MTEKQSDCSLRATVKGYMTNLYLHCLAGRRKEDVATIANLSEEQCSHSTGHYSELI